MTIDWYKGLAVEKDPEAVLDYAYDFGNHPEKPWLEDGDSLQSHSVVADAGITVDSSAIVGDQVVVWLSGGTPGESYDVTVRAVSAQGRTDDKTVTFNVEGQ